MESKFLIPINLLMLIAALGHLAVTLMILLLITLKAIRQIRIAKDGNSESNSEDCDAEKNSNNIQEVVSNLSEQINKMQSNIDTICQKLEESIEQNIAIRSENQLIQSTLKIETGKIQNILYNNQTPLTQKSVSNFQTFPGNSTSQAPLESISQTATEQQGETTLFDGGRNNNILTKTEEAYRHFSLYGPIGLEYEPILVELDSGNNSKVIGATTLSFRRSAGTQTNFLIFMDKEILDEGWLYPNPRSPYREMMTNAFSSLSNENFEQVKLDIQPKKVKQVMQDIWETI